MAETKTVLGRVFTWDSLTREWGCDLTNDQMLLLAPPRERIRETWRAILWDEAFELEVAEAKGNTEADAVLALQATLRKMAELEVPHA